MIIFLEYCNYKNTGVDWLGEISEHWKLQQFPIKPTTKINHQIESGKGLDSLHTWHG